MTTTSRDVHSGSRWLDAVLARTATIVGSLDADGRLLYVSPSADRVLGLDPRRIRGQRARNYVHPEDRARVASVFSAVVSSPDKSMRVACRVLNNEGGWERLEFTLTNLLADPVVGGVVFSGHKTGAENVLVTDLDTGERQLDLLLEDPLTGLPTRQVLVQRLEGALVRATAESTSVMVAIVDIDGFRKVNELLGTQGGDDFLCRVGRRLLDVVRPEDTAARLDSDEFGILCEGVLDERRCTLMAAKLLESLSGPETLFDGRPPVTVSIGVALVNSPGGNAEAVLREADAALWRSKQRGGASYELSRDNSTGKAARRQRIGHHIRQAVEREQLYLAYQPVVDLAGGSVVGVEALLRWMDPELGLLMPSEFIKIAEDTGSINELGSWVISEGCVQSAGWDLQRLGHPRHPRVSVNVSTRQLDRSGFEQFVQDAIHGAGLTPGQVGIEVTESALMADIEHAAGVLARLHAQGVRIALDDFGTGYSSLSYLRQLPIDVLKIDRSFIADLDDTGQNMAIVSRIVELAHDLGFTVVAEGVETSRQLEALEAVGCDAAQGFLFGRPVASAVAGALLGIVPTAFSHRPGR